MPRASWWPLKGVDKTLGAGQDAASSLPGKAGELAQKPFESSRKATNRSAQKGREGRAKLQPDSMIALLANPDSGSGEAGEVERLLRERGFEVSRFDLDHVNEAVASQPRRIVVAGGDGSVGCAARRRRPRSGVPRGRPVGTANDFARALDLPEDAAEATELAANGAREPSASTSAAWEAAVRQRRQRRPFTRGREAGTWPQARARPTRLYGRRAVGRVARAPVEVRVNVDGEQIFDGRAWQVIVAVTGAFGGGADVEANPADGRFDVVVIEATSRVRLVLHGYGLRPAGWRASRVCSPPAGPGSRSRPAARPAFNVDGELLDDAGLEFTIEPRAFDVVCG